MDRIIARLKAWTTEHLVAVDPDPALSNLDVLDGVGSRDEPRPHAHHDAVQTSPAALVALEQVKTRETVVEAHVLPERMTATNT